MNDAFSGTVLLAGRTMPLVAMVRIVHGRVEAVASDGTGVSLVARELLVETGGSSGTMVFCRDPNGTTVMVDAPGFLEALEAAAPDELGARVGEIRRGLARSTRWNRVLAAAGLAVLAAGLAGALALPKVLDRAVDAVPPTIEQQIGDAAVDALGPPLGDPLLDDAVDRIVRRLAPHARSRAYRFRARVVASDEINAFALPGGSISVCLGLLRAARSPEEVAGVIAHEMAHVTERHGLRSLVRQAGFVVGVELVLGDLDGLASYARDGATFAVLRGYSRADETRADELGVRTLLAARVDPRALARFFRTLERESASVPMALEWMGTHPDTRTRIDDVERLAGTARGPYRPLDVDWSAVRAAITRHDREDEPH